MDDDGSGVTRLTADEAAEYQPVWSPDGARIAFVRPGVETGNEFLGIFTMNSDGSDVHRVSSSDGGSDFSPSWSPDGSQLAFVGFRWEDCAIWIVNADGTGEHEITFTSEMGAWFANRPVWSPDGTLIAFACRPAGQDGGAVALCLIHPDGTGLSRIAEVPHGAGDIAWQPIPAPAETIEPTPAPTSAEIVATFDVGVDVSSVAYGEGSVWIAASNNDGTFGGRFVRIDPDTHEVQADIPVEVIPTWEVGGGAMVVADGSLWVTGSLDKPGAFEDPGGGVDAAVIRIDASTNEVVQTFNLVLC